MRRLRTASTRRLAAVLAVASAIALTAAVAQGALRGSGPTPQPKALASAILDAFKAPAPAGVTARIAFTNRLLPTGALPGRTVSPLMAGAGGRLWIQRDGDLRIELQSDAGDAQIVAAGNRLTVYDASSQTLYRATLPDDGAHAGTRADHGGEQLTLAKVQKVLDRLARTWTVSGAQPTSTAGRPAYTVKLSPHDGGGLLGAAELAWDAVRGAPLRAAVYARGHAAPVLELKATEISYGAVADADVRVAPPAGAEVVDLSADASRSKRPSSSARRVIVRGAGAVQRELRFDLAAPARLAGMALRDVRLVGYDGERGALAIYGEGLGAIAVLQRRARPAGEQQQARGGLRLPQVDVDGTTGSELATGLGTIVTFERGGVRYVVAGSVRPVVAEKAARELR